MRFNLLLYTKFKESIINVFQSIIKCNRSRNRLALVPRATGNTVTIDGVTCDVTSESVTQVVCVTNGHTGPGRFSVMVDVPSVGFAKVCIREMFWDSLCAV